jgi:hypothetical protein
MTGTDYTLFTHKSVPVIFEPPCIYIESPANILDLVTTSSIAQDGSASQVTYVKASVHVSPLKKYVAGKGQIRTPDLSPEG